MNITGGNMDAIKRWLRSNRPLTNDERLMWKIMKEDNVKLPDALFVINFMRYCRSKNIDFVLGLYGLN